MKNERGLTLIELLAVLAVVGIMITLLTTVFINGFRASERSATNQKLQQEANYITETVRKEYLKRQGDITDVEYKNEIKLESDAANKVLKMNGKIISEGYTYSVTPTIARLGSPTFELTIEKDGKSFSVDTIFSKLQ
ncbi:type II secretion system protein [Sporosarcina sp. HYO08]|uniref:type II secretion system protein n=1 Tax=Sporosarcina sp. HYO08 TaxID=1759557 RepID=UPI0007959741|nr:type II secretion system protein [Sporosarcina sp. HYO08]KXH87302.1 hypothetical protein AU377_01635 [Sporosarcina sp. HYO08]